MAEDIKTLKGAKILYKRTGSNDVEEGFVNAFSRDQRYVNLAEGHWLPTEQINVVDVLRPAPAAPDPDVAPQQQQQRTPPAEGGTETGTNGAAN